MRKVKFIEDFATKKKGDRGEYDSALASTLVRHDKVAVYADEEHQARLEKLDKEEQKRTAAAEKKIKEAQAKVAKEEQKRLSKNAEAEEKKKEAEEALIKKYGKK